jgi:hypothetical protein
MVIMQIYWLEEDNSTTTNLPLQDSEIYDAKELQKMYKFCALGGPYFNMYIYCI